MNAVSSSPPVGRLAPSPTGHLHLGHARSFLVAWWHARSRGGRIVLRIEDLDVERVKSGMSDETLRDLEWLGLDWDGAPCIQSTGVASIEAAADELAARGLAYPCICTRAEIEAAASAPHGPDGAGRYPGTCRGKFTSIADAERASGRKAALRFMARPGEIGIEDGVMGARSFDIARDAGDFVVMRRAGSPAYQLAVVVDDARQGVNEVVRGADLLESAARQKLLQEALSIRSPKWWHVPLVVDASGRRFAKRSDDIALAKLRSAGLDPRRVVAWVARHSGIERAEPATAREFTSHFDMRRLPRRDVVVDERALVEFT